MTNIVGQKLKVRLLEKRRKKTQLTSTISVQPRAKAITSRRNRNPRVATGTYLLWINLEKTCSTMHCFRLHSSPYVTLQTLYCSLHAVHSTQVVYIDPGRAKHTTPPYFNTQALLMSSTHHTQRQLVSVLLNSYGVLRNIIFVNRRSSVSHINNLWYY